MSTTCQICGGAIPDGDQPGGHTALCAGVVGERLGAATRERDTDKSVAFSEGATRVWESIGVGADPEFPNEAVWSDATGVYVVRPKTPGKAVSSEPTGNPRNPARESRKDRADEL